MTTVGTASPSINGLATPASTGVTSPIQSEESHGVISGTGIRGRRRMSEDFGHPVEHLAVGEHVGAADLNLPPRRRFDRQRLDQVAQGVVDRDRLGRVLQPRRCDHRRQPLHEVAQRAVGLALRPDDHPGAEVGQRRAILAERERGLVPAAQVLGLRAVTEAAEVDDPLDPLRARHPGERRGGGALAGGEVLGSASTHRVDQVIRHVHPVACAAQRFRTQHVSLVQIEAVALELAGAGPAAVAHQASHLPSRACQPGGEASRR